MATSLYNPFDESTAEFKINNLTADESSALSIFLSRDYEKKRQQIKFLNDNSNGA